MPDLADVQLQAAELSAEDRGSLIAYLVHSLPDAPLGPDDEELKRRIEEVENGEVELLSHEEFLREVGR